MANTVTINVKARDAASSEIDRVKGKLNALTTSKGFKSAVQGVGMGVGMQAWGMLSGAIGRAVGVAEDAVRAAVEEQASRARLDATLAANVRGYDSSSDAIERGISARMRLGFSDDALRDSMNKLIPITRDVGQAQRVQAAAMDLARFKGIDLETSSLAIGKAMQGNKKMLKELGIAVSDAGTGYQTLSEIQKVVAGQAETYAGTLAGKQAAAAAHVGQSMADAGAVTVDWTDAAMTGLDALAYGLTNMGTTMEDWARHHIAMQQAAQATSLILSGDLYGATKLTGDSIGELNAQARESAGALPPVTADLADAADAAGTAASKLYSTADAYDAMKRALSDSNDLKELPLRIAVAKDDVVKAQEDLSKARTGAEKRQAKLRLQVAKDELATLKLELESRTAKKSMFELGERLGGALSSGFESGAGPLSVTIGGGGVHSRGKALGGPVDAGGVYRVGELRPEYFVPAQSGFITPNPPQAAGGGAEGHTHPIYLDGRLVGKALDAASYHAQLGAVPSGTRS